MFTSTYIDFPLSASPSPYFLMYMKSVPRMAHLVGEPELFEMIERQLRLAAMPDPLL